MNLTDFKIHIIEEKNWSIRKWCSRKTTIALFLKLQHCDQNNDYIFQTGKHILGWIANNHLLPWSDPDEALGLCFFSCRSYTVLCSKVSIYFSSLYLSIFWFLFSDYVILLFFFFFFFYLFEEYHWNHLEIYRNIQPQCMVYCNARRILPTDHLYLTCFAAFNAIRDCFREHLENNANLYGDK